MMHSVTERHRPPHIFPSENRHFHPHRPPSRCLSGTAATRPLIERMLDSTRSLPAPRASSTAHRQHGPILRGTTPQRHRSSTSNKSTGPRRRQQHAECLSYPNARRRRLRRLPTSQTRARPRKDFNNPLLPRLKARRRLSYNSATSTRGRGRRSYRVLLPKWSLLCKIADYFTQTAALGSLEHGSRLPRGPGSSPRLHPKVRKGAHRVAPL